MSYKTRLKGDHIYVEVFMGSDYDLSEAGTVGGLRGMLEEIIDELPKDEELELDMDRSQLAFTLKKGITR